MVGEVTPLPDHEVVFACEADSWQHDEEGEQEAQGEEDEAVHQAGHQVHQSSKQGQAVSILDLKQQIDFTELPNLIIFPSELY